MCAIEQKYFKNMINYSKIVQRKMDFFLLRGG